MALRRIKRVCGIAVLAIGLVSIGVVIGPWVHVLYWSKVLDWDPDIEAKSMACLRLSKSESGKLSLHSRLSSPDAVVRQYSVHTLAYAEEPDAAAFLFAIVPKEHVAERLDILNGLESRDLQYWWVTVVLTQEMKNSKNDPRVRARAAKVLQLLKEAQAGLPKTVHWKVR